MLKSFSNQLFSQVKKISKPAKIPKLSPMPQANGVRTLTGQTPLKEHDPELFQLIKDEEMRQRGGLELIASENFTSTAVMQCLGSCLTNKYSEGYPGRRYYGGNEVVDQIEIMAQKRALAAYGLNEEEWGCNVQPYSGSPANFAVYTALLNPHDRIMGLDLPSGGHLTHGFYTVSKKSGERKSISATSKYFESMPYRVSLADGYIDYEALDSYAALFKPKMIICGGSAYPREWDYKKFREICDKNGSLLFCDMAHIGGLVAAGVVDSPFAYCDIVTTTVHKSLRGPRAGMIFFRRDNRDFEERINQAVFPGLQGGPHDHQIAAIATQMKEVQTDEFKQYAKQVVSNAQAIGKKLTSLGYTLATGGTDNHLVLWDLRPQGLTGSKIEHACDLCHITLNKNAVIGDKSALSPGGVRIGAPALTTRGFKEADFEKVGEFLDRVVKISLGIQGKVGKKLSDFKKEIKNNEEIKQLSKEVNEFAMKFPMPGVEL